MMTTNSKFGLRNGTDLLNILRRKYAKEVEESPLLHNKTFVDDESLELYENGNKEESRIMSQPHSKSKDDPPLEAISEIKPAPTAQTSFCDRLITRNLEQTLAIYKQDLQILSENKAMLQEKIEFMADKIRKLKQLQISNKTLSAQNGKAKEFLTELVREYHQSLHLLFKTRLQQQEAFNSLRTKIRIVLKELGEDYYYIGFVQHWNSHLETLQRQRGAIEARVREEQRAEMERIKEEVQKVKEEAVKAVKIEAPKGRTTKYEEDQFLAPDEPKPKKRLSQLEKMSLLGDLKSFAKNFKFPSG